MSVSKINDRYYRTFLVSHLDNRFTERDLFDVVLSLNPANKKYKIESDAVAFSNVCHQMDMKVMYQFRTEKAAELFVLTYKNLIQKGQSNLDIRIKENKVLLKFKESMFVDNGLVAVGENIADKISKREERQLLSDIFIRTTEQIFTSGIYQEKKVELGRFSRRQVGNSDALRVQENKISENKNETSYSLYKRTMLNNAIESNPRVNSEVINQINKAKESNLIDENNCTLLINRSFRDFSSSSLIDVVNKPNKRIQLILENAGILSQKDLRNNGEIKNKSNLIMEIRKGISNVLGNKVSTEDVVQIPKVFKFNYK